MCCQSKLERVLVRKIYCIYKSGSHGRTYHALEALDILAVTNLSARRVIESSNIHGMFHIIQSFFISCHNNGELTQGMRVVLRQFVIKMDVVQIEFRINDIR